MTRPWWRALCAAGWLTGRSTADGQSDWACNLFLKAGDMIMRVRIPTGFCLALGALAWSAAGAGSMAVSDSGAAAKLDELFFDPLPAALAMAGGGHERRLLRTCRDYLAVKGQIVGSDSEVDFRVLRAKGVDCDALAVMGMATTAARSALPRDFLTVTETRLYPASLWTNLSDDERAKAARPSSTLQSMSSTRRFKASRPNTLLLEDPAYGIPLTLLARGDFNGDGWEDAAFRWSGYARRGSYRDARMVVLTRIGTRPSSGFVEWMPSLAEPQR